MLDLRLTARKRTVSRRVAPPTRVASALVAALALAGCSSWAPLPKQPLLDAVEVNALVVEPVDIPGAPLIQAWFSELVSSTATAAAKRSTLERHLAAQVFDTDESADRRYRLSGVVRVPLSLPPDVAGSQAVFREGTLAVATLTLKSPDGTSQSGEVVLGWKKGDWLMGDRHHLRRRRQELALLGVVERSIDEAIEDLVRQVAAAHGE